MNLGFPKTGYKRMIASLIPNGHRVKKKQVRESMRRVDPDIIHRRKYSVPSSVAY